VVVGIETINWKLIYQRYVQLQRIWAISGAPTAVAEQFFRSVIHGGWTKTELLQELRSLQLEAPRSDMVSEAFFLREVLYPAHHERPGGRHSDDPMENVYSAALSMLPHGFWTVSPECAQLYRGQRNATWPTIPSLFRTKDVNGTLKQLGHAVRRIQVCLPSASEEQALAVAQHYAKELEVKTWLLDVTYDPRVALFFASDGGIDGEIGIVVCLVASEWNRLSADGTNRLGRLRVIDVPGVPRIANQRASFLDTSHPQLFDQYVANAVWFRQVRGLRFEDPDSDFPITEERIYPRSDPVASALANTPQICDGVLRLGPAGTAGGQLGSKDYLELALSWSQQAGIEIDIYHEDTLKVVCDVHARIQEPYDAFRLAERSLLRLWDAVELIMKAQKENRYISPKTAMEQSLGRLESNKQALLNKIIVDCACARDLC
jgi:FRG domain